MRSSRLPPLNALRAFEAAARHASFSHAADELEVTHGAVSKQIRALEDDLGQPLFSRSVRQVKLTSAGEGVYGRDRTCAGTDCCHRGAAAPRTSGGNRLGADQYAPELRAALAN